MENSWVRRCYAVMLAGIALGASGLFRAAAAPPPVEVPPVIQRNYDEARRRFQANPDDDNAAWQLGRACFDRAEFSRDNAERAALANEGIAACRPLIARQPRLPEGHYYLAMDLAQLARTKMLGALPLLSEMRNEWLAAESLDERLDYAGPDRFVGLLFRDAPGWPISLGDDRKAKQHLRRALRLAPNFPENHLNMIESYFKWNDTNAAARAMEKYRQLLPAMRKEFSGEYWEPSWKDWNERLERIQKQLDSPSKDPMPRHR